MIKLILSAIDRLLAKVMLVFIWLYQKTISPDKGLLSFRLKGKVCPHKPHCSQYGKNCFERYGFWQGLPLTADRVLHCLPSMQKIYDPASYRVVFISSAQIGVPFLEELVQDERFDVVGVVSQPDKPVGRGLKMQPNIIKSRALELGIPEEAIQTPTKINPEKSIEGKNFFDRLVAQKPDFIVVIAYGKIIPQSILDIPPFGAINVHGSLLPKYRGASPIQTIFLSQEQESGITIMHMDAGMDTGDIIAQKAFPLPFEWNCLDCIEHMQQIGPRFLTQVLRKYAKAELKAQPQDHTLAIDCKKIEKADGEIVVLSETLESVYAKYRAYFLWPKIHFKLGEKSVIIEKLVLDEAKYYQDQTSPLFTSDGKLHPAVQDISLKPEGKKAMDRASFKNGYLR